ncbi:MAG: radical SAM protein, partial [Pseudomonadota bacterium]
MNCQILRTLYLKANGIIPCEDNRGEWIDLGKVSLDPDWSIEQVLNNEHYAQIRSALAAGEMPWPKTCADCAMLRPHQPVKDTIAQKRIEKLQIETTLACALRCPGCSSLGQLALRSKPHTLPLEIYERLLQSLADEGYRIDFIEYCGQGEPLAHPKFAEFVRIGRRLFPETKQRLVTNGNYSYAKKLEGEYIDEIYVSADGITQENYEKYRVRGNIELAKQFMRDAADPGAQMRPLLVWKYILFEFNHSDEEIRAA